MYTDQRGGHNKKFENYNFFKTWSTNMAYVLGFIYADGAIEDVRKSSRTCYLSINIGDLDLLKSIKKAMSSKHRIYTRKEHLSIFPGNKIYMSKATYILRIGSKQIFQDLINLGLKTRKSLDIKFPNIPKKYLDHFIRGYFDGDGCIYLGSFSKTRKIRMRTIFTSGSKMFLDKLSTVLSTEAKTNKQEPFYQNRSFRLTYGKNDSLKLLNFMYKDISNSIYLARKYNLYQKYLVYNI